MLLCHLGALSRAAEMEKGYPAAIEHAPQRTRTNARATFVRTSRAHTHEYIDTQYSRRAGTGGAIGHSPCSVAPRSLLHGRRVEFSRVEAKPRQHSPPPPPPRILDACTTSSSRRARIPCITESWIRLACEHTRQDLRAKFGAFDRRGGGCCPEKFTSRSPRTSL